MSKQTFKVGDKVYCFSFGVGVYTVQPHHSKEYPLKISNGKEERSFKPDGRLWRDDPLQSLYHATEENRAALEQLHGLEFEAPTKTGSDRVRELLAENPNRAVLCGVSDVSDSGAQNNGLVIITSCNNTRFYSVEGVPWKYAVPFSESKYKLNAELYTGS